MKIGVISDIHSNRYALDAVLEKLSGVDTVICAGDVTGYYLWPGEVIQRLKEEDIRSVRGNHDDAVATGLAFRFNPVARKAVDINRELLDDRELEYLKDLPDHMRWDLGGKDTYMVHGSPRRPISEYIYAGDVDRDFLDENFDRKPRVLIMGHTHMPFAKNVGATLVLNPGSVGQPRDGDPRASYAILDTEKMEARVHRARYAIDEVVEEAGDRLPERLLQRLKKGR
ncbi:MAG: metallophosphoesterase [Candidatus Nanohaloarchaea archaeon]